ncbi:MAG: OmpA family protein [Acidobacteriota bacterium]
MSRVWLALAFALVPTLASADPADQPFELGGFLGPRLYSGSSALGFIDGAPAHPMLQNTVELGARASHQFLVPWLYPEFELGLAPTHTNAVGGASEVGVFWLEPRVQLRFELGNPHQRLLPFAVLGGGSPIALSSARKTFDSGIIGDGYFGGGVRFDTGRGFRIRFDARLAMLPGVDLMTLDNKLAFEGDVSLGIELTVGARRQAAAGGESSGDASDRDGDGIPDASDKCPDRPEDKDGFQDQDGCPDIDNDGDHVLDVADRCQGEAETYNGYQDDDGCPDVVPADIDAIRGTIEGLLYGEGETAVHDSAQASLAKIAKVMLAHPTIRVVLVGYTDDREAKAFLTKPEPGQPAQTVAQIAADLSRGRAEAVRQMLVTAGVPKDRIDIDGEGADSPVADNATGRGRLANRRVELKLFVPRP